MSLVTGEDVNLVGLRFAREERRRLLRIDALAQLPDHALGVVLVPVRLPGDLQVGQVQANEVQAQHPSARRLMVSREALYAF